MPNPLGRLFGDPNQREWRRLQPRVDQSNRLEPEFQVRLIENFDWISPPYQWHHTKEELTEWYEAAGFTVLSLLPHGLVPKPGALGKKKAP